MIKFKDYYKNGKQIFIKTLNTIDVCLMGDVGWAG